MRAHPPTDGERGRLGMSTAGRNCFAYCAKRSGVFPTDVRRAALNIRGRQAKAKMLHREADPIFAVLRQVMPSGHILATT